MVKSNGTRAEEDHSNENGDGEEQESGTPIERGTNTPSPSSLVSKREPSNGQVTPTLSNDPEQSIPLSNATEYVNDNDAESDSVAASTPTSPSLHRPREHSLDPSDDTGARLEALAQERAALRDEVTQLRRSLEKIQAKHEEDMMVIRGELEERTGEKEHAETQYRNLLGKVNTIRSQLGERLKADAVGSYVQRTILRVAKSEAGGSSSSQKSNRRT